MKKNHKMHIISGLIGAVLMGTSDWLLGYVNPTSVPNVAWDWLKQGYTDGYALWRPQLTMLLGSIAILFYLPAMWEMGRIFTDKTTQKRNSWAMITGLFGWLIIHYFFSVCCFVFAWLCGNGEIEFAGKAVTALRTAFVPSIIPWYAIMFAVFVYHFICVARGKSDLPKWMIVFHPLVWYLILYIGSIVLPASAFANGLNTFSINGSMIIWFAALLIKAQNGNNES